MTRRLPAILAGSVVLVAMLAAPSLAQDAPQPLDPGMLCAPRPVAPGGEVDCNAGAYVADATVKVEASIGTDTVFSDDVTADSAGFVNFTVPVPESAADGDVLNVTATGAVAVDGTEDTAATTVDVARQGLPDTGGGLAATGLLAAVMGAVALHDSTRRGALASS